MNPNDLPAGASAAVSESWSASEPTPVGACGASELLSPLLHGSMRQDAFQDPAAAARASIDGVVLGELLAITGDTRTPMVRYLGQPGAQALAARTAIDLHGPHIGQPVVLMFEHGDPTKPVVLGVLRGQAGWPLDDTPAQVEVDADGQRMVVSAKEQLVLRCGKASITLTKAGKVLIEGAYLLSRSTGVNRIKGGSVQLN